MKIAIIKYNAGNTQSVIYALRRLGIEPILTNDPEKIRSADKVIFPGVGEASTTMRHIKDMGLDKVIKSLEQPTLGICLGLQLLCSHSEENDTDCMGIFSNRVKKFPENTSEKIPHMGWNNLNPNKGFGLFEGLTEQDHAYFVHSYYAEISDDTSCKSEYIHSFSAGLSKGNFHAVQFHPEKSAETGAKILKNFIEII